MHITFPLAQYHLITPSIYASLDGAWVEIVQRIRTTGLSMLDIFMREADCIKLPRPACLLIYSS